jgi:hypothetical protein
METTKLEKPARRTNWLLVISLMVGIILILAFLILMAGSTSMGSHPARTAAELQVLDAACQSYTEDNGPFPKNLDNHTLWADLSGADSGKVYMSFRTGDVNTKGELIDSWGTPLRVWYISDKEVGITSAGPDKTFGTADDISNQ